MFFSVIIALYNKENYIERAIRGVLSQSHQDFELLVINDGSTDNGYEIVKKFNNQNIKLLHQTNAGVSAARNKGIELANGDFIAFLDADDEWLPNYLADMKKLIDKYPGGGIYAASYYIVRNDGQRKKADIKEISITEDSEGVIKDYFRTAFLGDPPVTSSTACIPKNVFSDIGDFAKKIRCGEDLDMWLRIALKYPIIFSKRPAAIYHYAVSNAANIYYPEEEKLINNWRLYYNKSDHQPYFIKYIERKQIQLALKCLLVGKREDAMRILISVRLKSLYLKKLLLLSFCMLSPTLLKKIARLKKYVYKKRVI